MPRPRPCSSRPTLWLDPGPYGAPLELVHVLADAVRLVVVPRTGSRAAQIAVLLDPGPAVLGAVRHVLPAALVVALPGADPGPALTAAAGRHGVHLLPPGTTPAQLLRELHLLAPALAARPLAEALSGG